MQQRQQEEYQQQMQQQQRMPRQPNTTGRRLSDVASRFMSNMMK
jgi:hypothetical protein